MKAWVFVLVLFGSVHGFAAAVIGPIDEPSLADLFGEEFPWKAVGLLQINYEDKKRLYQTGFFVGPNRFMTRLDPTKKEAIKPCQGETFVFSGSVKIVPEFEQTNVKASHRCTKIEKEYPEMGFVLLEMESLTKEDNVTLPFWSKKSELEEGEELVALGYAFAEGGELNASRQGLVTKIHYGFEHDYATSLWGDRAQAIGKRWAIGEMKVSKGMGGSPLLRKRRGQWAVVGLVSIDAVGDGKSEELPFPKIFEMVNIK